MSFWDIYKAIKVGRSDSLFASIAGSKLNQDAWKKGFNKWDEEWEVGGLGRTMNDGDPYDVNNRIRSKNFIPIIPSTRYYLHMSAYGAWRYFYDANYEFIAPRKVTYYDTTFDTPENAKYMKIEVFSDYGATYNNDICINISGEHNGEYVPYNG